MPPANWATGAWCSLQASILPPFPHPSLPRKRGRVRVGGALPNELGERIELEPSPGLEPGSPRYKSGASPQCFEGQNGLKLMVLAGGIKPPASALRERRSID